MSNTNYSDDKENTSKELKNSDLSDDIVKQIIKELPREVKINNLEDNHVLQATDLKGSDLVYSDDSGKINLNSAKVIDVKHLDALIFNSSPDQKEGVNLLMNKGAGADAFKGTVVTYGTDDTINLSGNGVKVSSGDGNDIISTRKGNDSIDSGNGNDSVSSNNGNDTVSTGAGNDSVSTGAGNDSVLTGSGNDSVLVGSGNDTVSTGSGIDIVKLAAGYTGTTKLDGGGSNSDTLDLSLADIANVQLLKNHLIVTLDNGSVVNSVNFEKFIYDSNGTNAGGTIETVGIKAFDAHDFNG
jgi:Ca2+-binding RTX toxin-like protein